MVIEKSLNYRVITENKSLNIFKQVNFKISNNKGMYIIHRALIKQLNCKRQNTANTKTRSEVQGGGRKPWKQKGSGKARAGSNRSPLWRGGGVIFGPKNQNYNIKINKKEKHLAIRTAIFNKFKNTLIIDKFSYQLDKPNTKTVIKQINNLGLNINKKSKILIVVKNKNHNLYLSIRNIKNIDIINANQINIYTILQADQLIITTNALDQINTIYNT